MSRAATPFSDAMAEKAMELLGKNIRRFVSDRSDREAAKAMLLGSNFAGIAFNLARLGNVHAMAHPVSAYFHAAHGEANGALFCVVLEYNELADQGRYKKIYSYLEQEPKESYHAGMLQDTVKKLLIDLKLPTRLLELGVEEDKIPAMAKDAMKSGNIAVNPRTTTQEDIERLYQLAM